MDEVVDAVNKGDVDSLLSQGRFLDEKFGQQPLSIEGPSPKGSPPSPPPGAAPKAPGGDPPAPPVTQF
jgi:hypothetical protein